MRLIEHWNNSLWTAERYSLDSVGAHQELALPGGQVPRFVLEVRPVSGLGLLPESGRVSFSMVVALEDGVPLLRLELGRLLRWSPQDRTLPLHVYVAQVSIESFGIPKEALDAALAADSAFAMHQTMFTRGTAAFWRQVLEASVTFSLARLAPVASATARSSSAEPLAPWLVPQLTPPAGAAAPAPNATGEAAARASTTKRARPARESKAVPKRQRTAKATRRQPTSAAPGGDPDTWSLEAARHTNISHDSLLQILHEEPRDSRFFYRPMYVFDFREWHLGKLTWVAVFGPGQRLSAVLSWQGYT